MADRSEKIITGTVTEALPNATFRIQLEDGNLIIGYLSGKMRIHKIKVLIGDKVSVSMASLGDARGRITKRL